MRELGVRLNELLATYQVYYQNLRGLHWNIQGQSFFELHGKYEEYYIRTQDVIDEIAERLLMLGDQPKHSFTAYLNLSRVEEVIQISEGKDGVRHVLKNQQVLLEMENEILVMANELADEGTAALISDLIREKEKTIWMLKAWLG